MAKPSPKLLWCVIRLGDDMNWWVKEISDEVHWDTDELSIVDPKQTAYILDLLDPLRDYGLSTSTVESAFIPFQIQSANPDKSVRLVRVNENILESEEMLFGLPDVVDEEKGPYADFIDHITKLRVKFLNDNIEFEQKLTVEELEEQVRDAQQMIYSEGKSLHIFQEIVDILEFVPDGYELAADEENVKENSDEEEIPDDVGDGFEIETDEKIEEDDTMRWEGDDDEEDEEDDEEEDGDEEEDEEEDEDEDAGSRRRRR